MNRIWHPYWEWEETKFNMWGRVEDRALYERIATHFTANHELYGECMLHVVREMPKSCEHNLSDRSQNRKAWVGQAACALAFRCPEDIVRKAWGNLTEQQQIDANAAAQKAIEVWECQNED